MGYVSIKTAAAYASQQNNPTSVYANMSGLPNLTIFAASSFTYPMVEIARVYADKYDISVSTSFDDTSEQVRKIVQGDPADIFISSHEDMMQRLKQNGLIDIFSITNIARNRLALVSAPDTRIFQRMPPNLNALEQLQYVNKKSTMVLSDPDDTSLGLYSKHAIMNIGARNNVPLWEAVSKNILRSRDAKETLYLITHGRRTGIVFYSDTYNNPEVNVLTVFDEDTHEPITYQAAVVAGDHMESARQFLTFLHSKEATTILRKYGFLPITEEN